jgi:hypothetical protein
MTKTSRLDELSEALLREVRSAAGARAGAEVAAAFDGMTKELNNLAEQLESYGAVVSGRTPLAFATTFGDTLSERRAWVDAQLEKVRVHLADDPMKVKQGKLWAETQRAVNTLRDDLAVAIDEAYVEVLAPFQGDDRRILETLPPGTPGVAAYRDAIEEFERLAEVRPSTPEEVTRATAVGRRMQRQREEVEAQAVPAEFSEQWRLLRTTGLPLTEMTDAFSAWLRERGFANSAVVTFGGR